MSAEGTTTVVLVNPEGLAEGLAEKADLDPATGKVLLSQMPTGLALKGDPGAPGSPGDPTLLLDDTRVSTSKTYSSKKIEAEIASIQGSASSGSGLQVYSQNADGSYGQSPVAIPVYAGATPPDPATLTGAAFFILLGS